MPWIRALALNLILAWEWEWDRVATLVWISRSELLVVNTPLTTTTLRTPAQAGSIHPPGRIECPRPTLRSVMAMATATPGTCRLCSHEETHVPTDDIREEVFSPWTLTIPVLATLIGSTAVWEMDMDTAPSSATDRSR